MWKNLNFNWTLLLSYWNHSIRNLHLLWYFLALRNRHVLIYLLGLNLLDILFALTLDHIHGYSIWTLIVSIQRLIEQLTLKVSLSLSLVRTSIVHILLCIRLGLVLKHIVVKDHLRVSLGITNARLSTLNLWLQIHLLIVLVLNGLLLLLHHLVHRLLAFRWCSVLITHLLEVSRGPRLANVLILKFLRDSNCVARHSRDLILIGRWICCWACLILRSFDLKLLRRIRRLLTCTVLNVNLVTTGVVTLVASLFALIYIHLMWSRCLANCISSLDTALCNLIQFWATC